jgi:hypothetical protein
MSKTKMLSEINLEMLSSEIAKDKTLSAKASWNSLGQETMIMNLMPLERTGYLQVSEAKLMKPSIMIIQAQDHMSRTKTQ